MSTRVVGTKEMREAFEAFGQEFEKGPMRRVTRRIGTRVAKLAREKAPKDEGTLRKSIKSVGLRPAAAKRAGFVQAVQVGPSNLAKAAAELGEQTPPSNYGAMVEGGTEKMEPRPYLRPAADEAASSIDTIAVEELRKDLDKVTRKAARLKGGTP